ncbi:MAG: type 1 glutamine amidotransferase [candidate division KSB1 bacterium]|nr:type 1 glutamine amidotransferase [candidate division KSB1 bacterium]
MPPWLILQHVSPEGPGLIRQWLEENSQQFVICHLWQEPIIQDSKDIRGLIIMGGPMSANDEQQYPFLRSELQLIETCLRQDLPILGICLGSQLLAKALGAQVYRGPKPEIGWYPIYFSQEAQTDDLFKGEPGQCWVFHWHGETFDLPKGAKLLASSAAYPHQAFKYENHAYGLQFHLEMTEEMINEWVKINKEELFSPGQSAPTKILRDTQHYLREMQEFGRHVVNRFCKL